MKVSPILNCGIRSSRTLRTTCTSSITTKFIIGVPGATNSPRFGKMLAICPSSGAVSRASSNKAETSSTVLLAASTILAADALSSFCAPSTAIWYCSYAARSAATAALYIASTSSFLWEVTTLSLYKVRIRLYVVWARPRSLFVLFQSCNAVATSWRRVPASIFLFCCTATCSKAFTCWYLAYISGLLITTRVSPWCTQSPSRTKNVSIRPGSFPLIRISVASACPWRTNGCLCINIIPSAVKTPTANIIMTKAHERVLLANFIVCYGLGW